MTVESVLLSTNTAAAIVREVKRTSRIARGATNRGRTNSRIYTRQNVFHMVEVLDTPKTVGGKRFFPGQQLHVAHPFLPDGYETHGDSSHINEVWLYPNAQDTALLMKGQRLICWNVHRLQDIDGDEWPLYVTDWETKTARLELRETLPAESKGPAFYVEYPEEIELTLHNMCGEIEVGEGETLKVIASPRSCNEAGCQYGEWETIVVCCP